MVHELQRESQEQSIDVVVQAISNKNSLIQGKKQNFDQKLHLIVYGNQSAVEEEKFQSVEEEKFQAVDRKKDFEKLLISNRELNEEEKEPPI